MPQKSNQKSKLDQLPDPETLQRREQELREQSNPSYRVASGWLHRGNPNWRSDEGRGPPKKEVRTKSQHLLKAAAAVAMANLARSAMAKFGYDGTGLGGAEGYMTMLAQRFPLQFMTDIIAKMIPQNVDATLTASIDITQRYESSEEARRDIAELAVPLDLLLERDDPPLLLEDAPARESGNGQG